MGRRQSARRKSTVIVSDENNREGGVRKTELEERWAERGGRREEVKLTLTTLTVRRVRTREDSTDPVADSVLTPLELRRRTS